MDKWMNSFRYSTGLYHSETIGINTTNIELILIILLVFMGGMTPQWLAMYIFWTDTEDIYIYSYTVVLQKAEETSTTEQNRTEQLDGI